MKLHLSPIESAMGKLLLVTDDANVVRALEFGDHSARLHRKLKEHYGTYELVDAEPSEAIDVIKSKLERYFSGELTALEDIAVATRGSAFEEAVWSALRHIPAGTVTSYGELA